MRIKTSQERGVSHSAESSHQEAPGCPLLRESLSHVCATMSLENHLTWSLPSLQCPESVLVLSHKTYLATRALPQLPSPLAQPNHWCGPKPPFLSHMTFQEFRNKLPPREKAKGRLLWGQSWILSPHNSSRSIISRCLFVFVPKFINFYHQSFHYRCSTHSLSGSMSSSKHFFKKI